MTLSQTVPAVSRFRSFTDSSAMARNPVEVLSKYTELLGSTFRFYLGGIKEAIVTTDPAVIQHVLKTNSENYHKSEIQVKRMGHFLGKGLLTTEGEAWRTQRRLMQKGFDRKQLDVLSSIMQDSLAESLVEFDRQARNGPVDIYPHLMKMTFGMVGRSLFGARLKSDDIDLISRTISAKSRNSWFNPDHSAISESLVHRLRRTAQTRGDANPRRWRFARIHHAAAPGGARPRSAADLNGRPLQRRRRHER